MKSLSNQANQTIVILIWCHLPDQMLPSSVYRLPFSWGRLVSSSLDIFSIFNTGKRKIFWEECAVQVQEEKSYIKQDLCWCRSCCWFWFWSFFFKVVVSRVGWIDTGRPSQSLELSRKWKVNVIRCQRFFRVEENSSLRVQHWFIHVNCCFCLFS